MPDTQKRLVQNMLGTAIPTDPGLYKANETGNINTIIRNIHVANVANSVTSFTMLLAQAGGGDDWNRRIFSGAVIGPLGGLDWSGFMVMNPGEFIAAWAGNANCLTLSISGIVIT